MARKNLAMLRRVALNPARLEPFKGPMKAKLKGAGWDSAFLAPLLAKFAILKCDGPGQIVF